MRISDWSSDVCSSDLRARSHATLSWRAGWAWCTVEGDAELIGPDDPVQGVTLPPLLRSIYASSGGGEHDDWADYDRVIDRKSVVSGKSVSVRVKIGCRRNIKKTKTKIKK